MNLGVCDIDIEFGTFPKYNITQSNLSDDFSLSVPQILSLCGRDGLKSFPFTLSIQFKPYKNRRKWLGWPITTLGWGSWGAASELDRNPPRSENYGASWFKRLKIQRTWASSPLDSIETQVLISLRKYLLNIVGLYPVVQVKQWFFLPIYQKVAWCLTKQASMQSRNCVAKR